MALLNRDGRVSNRNLDRPFKPQPVDPKTGRKKDVGNMKYGTEGKRCNTTGCFGTVSTWNVYLTMLKPTPGPTRPGRSPVKRKAVGNLYYGNAAVECKKSAMIHVRRLRDRMVTLAIMGNSLDRNLLRDSEITALRMMTRYLLRNNNEKYVRQMLNQDDNREVCIDGQIKSGKIYPRRIKNMRRDIEICLRKMRIAG